AGRGVRLAEQALLLETGQDVADRRRRQAERAVLGQPGRRHRFPLFDVLGNQGGEDPKLAVTHAASSLTPRVLREYSKPCPWARFGSVPRSMDQPLEPAAELVEDGMAPRAVHGADLGGGG